MSILCIGSAVIDIVCASVPDPAQWQEKQRIRQVRMLPGGDALNQSVTLSRLGQKVYLVSAAGPDDNGVLLRTMLEDRGVDTAFLAVLPETSTGTSVVLVGMDGEKHIFAAGGAYRQLTAADLPPLDGVQAVSVGSLLQMPALEQEGLAAYLHSAHGQGIPVFADLGSEKERPEADEIRALLPDIDYFLPSRKDALKITGTETPEAAAEALYALGSRHVVIKCGGDGSYYLSGTERGWVPALPVQPVDTTGAGDCMVAVFVSEILKGSGLQTACVNACRAASWSTLFMGAGGAPSVFPPENRDGSSLPPL